MVNCKTPVQTIVLEGGKVPNTGFCVSEVQVTVREAVPVFPQLSFTVHVLVCDFVHPDPVTKPVDGVGVAVIPQLSVAVAVPRAASICAAVGLHAKVKVVPVAVITGGMESLVQVTALLTGIAALPQLSVTFHVLVRVNVQFVITVF